MPNDSKQLAVRQTSAMTAPNEWVALLDMAKQIHSSGFLPDTIKTPQQLAAILLYGRSLNINEWTAIKHLTVIHNRPEPDAYLIMALLRRSGLLESFSITGDEKSCTVTMKRAGHAPMTDTVTIQDVGKIKTYEKGSMIPLTQKSNWSTMPKVMLQWFTLRRIAKLLFGDVLENMDISAPEDEGAMLLDEIEDGAPQAPPRKVDLDAAAHTFTDKLEDIAEGVIIEEVTQPAPAKTDPPFTPTITNSYDGDWVFNYIKAWFVDRKAFDAWLTNAHKDKRVTNKTTNEEMVNEVLKDIHIFSLEANRKALGSVLNTFNLTNADLLEKFYPDRKIARLGELPNDFNLVAERIEAIAKGTDVLDSDEPEDPFADDVEAESGYEDYEWTDERIAEFDAEIIHLFPHFKSATDLHEHFGVTGWTYPPAKERETIFADMAKNNKPVVSSTVSYHDGGDKGKSWIIFYTVLGEAWFFGTTEFAKLMPDAWVRANKVAKWKDYTDPHDIEPVLLTWEEKKRASGAPYKLVTAAAPAEDLDEKLKV